MKHSVTAPVDSIASLVSSFVTIRGARRLSGLVVVACTLSSGLVTAQVSYPIFTRDQLESTMKALGPNFLAARTSLDTSDFETAKAQLIRTREQLATTITFWRDREKDDAATFVRNTIALLDQLDDALSAERTDRTTIDGLVRGIGAGCQACHAVYRVQDPVTNEYSLKLGAD